MGPAAAMTTSQVQTGTSFGPGLGWLHFDKNPEGTHPHTS